MQLLKFIEVRFRNGISISDDEIKTYYEKTMLPEYARRKVNASAAGYDQAAHRRGTAATAGWRAAGRLAEVAAGGRERADYDARARWLDERSREKNCEEGRAT